MVMKRSLHLLILCFSLAGCSGKGETAKTDFSYSVGNLVNGTPMDGGFYLRAVQLDSDTGNEIDTQAYDLVNDAAEIPFGTWKFFLVGYAGPGAWSGDNYCGEVAPTVLESDETTVEVTINQANCANAPFPEIIAEKAASLSGGTGNFDSATFDSSTFAP